MHACITLYVSLMSSARNGYPGTRFSTRTRVPVPVPGYPVSFQYPYWLLNASGGLEPVQSGSCEPLVQNNKYALQSSSAQERRPMDEVVLYTQERTPDINTNPLQWWKLNGGRYPRLTILALKYLGIPATSVPSERVFSKAGEIVSRRRASLKPSSVDMLVFLSKNIPAVDSYRDN